MIRLPEGERRGHPMRSSKIYLPPYRKGSDRVRSRLAVALTTMMFVYVIVRVCEGLWA